MFNLGYLNEEFINVVCVAVDCFQLWGALCLNY